MTIKNQFKTVVIASCIGGLTFSDIFGLQWCAPSTGSAALIGVLLLFGIELESCDINIGKNNYLSVITII
jgi:hypothetical protein